MEETNEVLGGVFEGYLKKKKTNSGFILSDWNKRYFVLEIGNFIMNYYKNRKKKGTRSNVPLREMVLVVKSGPEGGAIEIGNNVEWGYEFMVVTRSRTYQFNAYSHNDREVWCTALTKIMDYK
jgi:hypothetical protein